MAFQPRAPLFSSSNFNPQFQPAAEFSAGLPFGQTPIFGQQSSSGFQQYSEPRQNIFVQGIFTQNNEQMISYEHLTSYLSRFGPVETVQILPLGKNQAIVQMKNIEDAMKVVEAPSHPSGAPYFISYIRYSKRPPNQTPESNLIGSSKTFAEVNNISHNSKLHFPESNSGIVSSTFASASKMPKHRRTSVEGPTPIQPSQEEVPTIKTTAPVFQRSSSPERKSQFAIGTCELMCPRSITQTRIQENQIDLLEKTHSEMPQLGNDVYQLAIMKFQRSSAMTHMDDPSLIRTEAMLDKTADYIWKNIIDIDKNGPDPRFRDSRLITTGPIPTPAYVLGFVFDRTKRIRQELKVQGYADPEGPRSLRVAHIYEECVRFHILTSHELCEHTDAEGFSAKLNREELNSSFTQLFETYEGGELKSENEPEMWAYYILMQLDSNDRFSANAEIENLNKNPSVMSKSIVTFAKKVFSAYHSGDYFTFFNIFRRIPLYLFACLMHSVLDKVRKTALSLINGAAYNRGGNIKFLLETKVCSRRGSKRVKANVQKWNEYQRAYLDRNESRIV